MGHLAHSFSTGVDVAVDVGTRQESEQQVNDSQHLWTAARQILRAQVSDAVWLSTFQDVLPIELADGQLVLGVPNSQIRERIEGRYLQLVRDALDEIGRRDVTVRLVVRPERSSDVSFAAIDIEVAPATSTPSLTSTPRDGSNRLHRLYTFDTFVKGASNQFALAAAQRVAETPARSYNPLFIYGAAGLGKTHLLHAIGHYVDQNYGQYSVRYVSTETFLNEYVDAIRSNSTALFKRRYRDVDVLLIDDIQFMEGKEGLQEEFFHTFNSLHGANKQIVISSDRMPDAIPTLEDRLRGRFKWGLITDIQPPDLETRLAILRNKAERDHSQIGEEVLQFIAVRITNNIRELEGALIRVSAYASLNQVPISPELAERLLADLLADNGKTPAHARVHAADHRRVLRFLHRSLEGEEPPAPLGHCPPNRHVRHAGPHRSLVPGHRPRVRRP